MYLTVQSEHAEVKGTLRFCYFQLQSNQAKQSPTNTEQVEGREVIFCLHLAYHRQVLKVSPLHLGSRAAVDFGCHLPCGSQSVGHGDLWEDLLLLCLEVNNLDLGIPGESVLSTG